MLAKCVLISPPRQGKSNKADTAAFTKARCERWLAGELFQPIQPAQTLDPLLYQLCLFLTI